MKVAVFGGSGFIGSHLIRDLAEQGEEVVIVSRSQRSSTSKNIHHFTWHELENHPEYLEHFDAFINLAGESINQRWTKAAKRRIVESRIVATGKVEQLVKRLVYKPEVVINGSGMSIYGYSESAVFDEASPRSLTDF